ncbi:rod shape-determining protein MreC, partial [bacterium]|nr:rod shape-determining protein MreC [bacterium]
PQDSESTYFEKGVFLVFSPIQHGIVWVYNKTGEILENYFLLRNVKKENEKMRKEIFYTNQENVLLRKAIKKFKSEQKVRKLLEKIHQDILYARVIRLDASNFYKSAVINRGSLDGVKKNMVVLDRHGNLVGRIIEPISPKESRVQLITDNESGISVFSEKKKVMGVLSGDGNGNCFLKYIIRTNENIAEGEKLITSGFDGIYPSGINVGTIISITEDSSLFKNIKVNPFFQFRELDQVAVIMRDARESF